MEKKQKKALRKEKVVDGEIREEGEAKIKVRKGGLVPSHSSLSLLWKTQKKKKGKRK